MTYAGISPSEPPLRRWADGAAEAAFAAAGGETRLRHLYQSDPCRVLFPRAARGAPAEAVVVTTSGGVVGGDRIRVDLAALGASAATATTQAAEKIYRSAGPEAEIAVALRADAGALLEWVPQETILFDGARLRRETRIDVARTARLIAGEINVFGRRARGEDFRRGSLRDAWRLRRGGRLAWAESLRLGDGLGDGARGRFAFGDAAAAGLLLYCGPRPAPVLDAARRALGDGPGGAATCIDGVVVSRLCDADAARLRRRFADLWRALRGAAAGRAWPLPRVWSA